jgi:hypothetical protein
MAQRSRFIGAGATALAAALLVALPSLSSGATVQNDLRSFPAAKPRVAHTSATPRTEPPLHGTNPHAQGTAAVVDITPNADRPFTVDEAGTSSANEDIVIGRSRGERRANGDYHGHITAAALFGNEIIEVADTGPGQRQQGSLLAAVLNPLCASTGICLGVVEYDSNTTTTGSFNSFRTLSASLGGAVQLPGVPGLPVVAPPALNIGAASSVGNLSTSGTCQTAVGSSRVADVNAGAAPVVGIAQSSSESVACSGAGSSQTNTSRVVDLNGDPVALLGAGCANGAPDTEVNLLLVTIICNAEDSSKSGGTQADSTAHVYGVRNALDVYVLAVGPIALAQVSTAQSESLAVAPAAVTTTPTTTTTTTTTTPAATTTVPTGTTTTPAPTQPAATDDGGGTDDTGDEAGNEGAGDEGAGDDGAGDGTPECSDGVDNDGDGKVDFGSDPECSSAADDSEAGNVSLAGNELPFTGSDIVVLGLAGSLLLAAGLTLRGPARRREFDA